MTDAKRIAQLIIGLWLNTLSVSKKAELDAWLNSDPANRAFLQEYKKPVPYATVLQRLSELNKESLRNRLWDRIDQVPEQITTISKKRIKKYSYMAAAALLVIVAISFLYQAYSTPKKFSDNRPPDIKEQLDTMGRPVQQPMLTVDRYELDLNKLGLTETAPANGWNILKTENQHVVYRNANRPKLDSPVVNTFSLPKNDTNLWVTLPDGTQMDLDPGSSARFKLYPFGVKTSVRIVILNGQARFEVAHDPESPFFIETAKTELKVLGTHLTIRDFSAEDSSDVMVLNGSVLVSNGRINTKLDSGQRAHTLSSSKLIQVSTITRMPRNRARQKEVFDFSKKDHTRGD